MPFSIPNTSGNVHAFSIAAVDGRNPPPVDMENIPLLTRFYTFQVVQDFFHQQYVSLPERIILRGFFPAQSQSATMPAAMKKIGQMTRKSPTIFQFDISLTFSIDVLLMEEILHHLGSIKS